MMLCKIGISGWSYPEWREKFYPPKLKSSDWLKFYSTKFDTIELNSTFYSGGNLDHYRKWYEETPRGFIFSVKAGKLITHVKRLTDAKDALNEFLKKAEILKEKLGPILFQLPPNLICREKLLTDFFDILPQGFKYTIEFRNEAWKSPGIMELLRARNICLCISSWKEILSVKDISADFLYLRFHGTSTNYKGAYGETNMKLTADWLKSTCLPAYVYFNNTNGYPYAAEDAKTLQTLLAS